jgi:UDP-glucose 4-epimerase
MRLLLTGATGFIGSSFTTSYEKQFDIEAFSFRNDLNALSINGIDAVVHLAALVHQMGRVSLDAYHEVNVVKTIELAQKAKEAGVKQFVFISSVKVYGEESDTPYNEDTPCHPKDPYGKSKLEAEKALLALQNNHFKVAVIRTPVVYGEGVKANILRLITLTDKYQYLPFASINNKRSMVYLENLTHLMSEIIIQKAEGIFLASDVQPLSTTKLVKSIAKALEKKPVLFSSKLLNYIIKLVKPSLYQRLYQSLYVDNASTRSRLHLQNPYSTQEGIAKMIAWYKVNQR